MALYNVVFERQATKELRSLDDAIAEMIVRKLRWYADQTNPLNFASQLGSPSIGKYRFRIGDYRAIFDLRGDRIVILSIGHRSRIYR